MLGCNIEHFVKKNDLLCQSYYYQLYHDSVTVGSATRVVHS